MATPYDRLDGVDQTTTAADAADQAQAVVLTSTAWGQDGGNDLTAQLKDPGAPNAPLGVGRRRQRDHGQPGHRRRPAAVTTTADAGRRRDQRRPAAAALVTRVASTAPTPAPAGRPTAAATALSDFLKAPASYPRGPQTVQMIRIGTHRDGTKTGVFLYCQEHAREWATSLVCLETAERLLRNYATDPETKDLARQPRHLHRPGRSTPTARRTRATTSRRSAATWSTTARRTRRDDNDPLGRNSLGRRHQPQLLGRLASSTATSARRDELHERHVRRPGRVLRARVAQRAVGAVDVPEHQVRQQRPLLRRLLHVASGRLQDGRPRDAAVRVLRHQPVLRPDRRDDARADPVLPQDDRPAGPDRPGRRRALLGRRQLADEAYYSHGIIGYDFEIGVDRFTGAVRADGTAVVQEQGFTPPYTSEGHDEGQEFANGNIGLLTAALELRAGHDGAGGDAEDRRRPRGGLDMTFDQSEPADIYYTTGRLDADQRPRRTYAPAGPRQRVQAVHLPGPVDAEVVRRRHQEAGVGGPDLRLVLARARRRRRRHGAGDAVADAGRAGDVRGVHAGHHEDLRVLDDGQRDLDRGRRALSVADPSASRATWSTARSPAAAAAGRRSRNGDAWTARRSPTTPVDARVQPAHQRQRRAAHRRYSKTLTFTLSTTTP